MKKASEKGGGVKIIVHPFTQKTNITTASITSDVVGYMEAGVGQAAYAGMYLAPLFTTVTLPENHHGVIYYTDQTTVTRNADMKAEAAAAPESALAWTTYNKTLEKIFDSIPVTYEALNDIDFVQSEIDTLMNVNLRLKEDGQLWSGTGTAPQIQGAYTAAQTFAYGSYTGETTTVATLYDLCMLLKEQITTSYGGKFVPNTVIVNPQDALAAKWVKDSNGLYVRNPFVSPDGNQIAGMTIVESASVTANTMLIGDFRYAKRFIKGGVEIEMGYDSDDFSKDLTTIKARLRIATLIRNVDTYGFLKVADIDSALAAITTPSA